MKYLLTLFPFVVFTNTFAQTQDLAALTKGDYLGMNALFDEKGSLFGYISLYNYGKSGDKTKKFEYVIMDKNLNPFANKTFDGDITAANYTGYINFDGKVVLKPTHIDLSFVKRKEIYMPSSMIIDLKENTIQRKVFYEYDNDTFKEKQEYDTWKKINKEYDEEKSKNGFVYSSEVIEIKEGGFVVFGRDKYKDFSRNCHVLRYDENKKQLWRYEYGKYNTERDWEYLRILAKNEKYLYSVLIRSMPRAEKKYYLIVLDMQTGKEVHKKEIDVPADVLANMSSFPTDSYGQLNNDRTFDDKIVTLIRTEDGRLYTGFARLMIDKNTFKVDYKTILYGIDFKPHLPYISGYGEVEKHFYLDPRDIFFMKDGSIGILFEKYKPGGQNKNMKTTDMVYVYTDKNFKVTGAKVMQKETSIWSANDYLFAQYLNDNNDLVFFYRDYQKSDESKHRNWNLFINTMIGGVFNQQMIPISSRKNFFIFPYIAKEGYILLQEFNKEAKHNQVRLERLNY